ncbi:MAG: Peptide-methionine (S)-S-oxide reductase MsrA, partial [uncultured Sphingomonadaceae bacterium]
ARARPRRPARLVRLGADLSAGRPRRGARRRRARARAGRSRPARPRGGGARGRLLLGAGSRVRAAKRRRGRDQRLRGRHGGDRQLRRGQQRAHRPRRSREDRLRPRADQLRYAAPRLLRGGARPDAAQPAGPRQGPELPFGDLPADARAGAGRARLRRAARRGEAVAAADRHPAGERALLPGGSEPSGFHAQEPAPSVHPGARRTQSTRAPRGLSSTGARRL